MERNEEIKQALSRYVKNRGVSGNHIVDVERDAAFIAGALWADNNPDLSSLWHDASEMPCLIKQWYLVLDCENKPILTNEIFVIKARGVRWAFVDDLLPKGGER